MTLQVSLTAHAFLKLRHIAKQAALFLRPVCTTMPAIPRGHIIMLMLGPFLLIHQNICSSGPYAMIFLILAIGFSTLIRSLFIGLDLSLPIFANSFKAFCLFATRETYKHSIFACKTCIYPYIFQILSPSIGKDILTSKCPQWPFLFLPWGEPSLERKQ